MESPPLQPNLQLGPPQASARFWSVLVLTGMGAGLAGGLLMTLLRWVEREAWPAYRRAGDFLEAVRASSAERRLTVLLLAALIAGVGRRLLSRHKTRAHGGDVVEAIWLGSGVIAPLRTFANSILSVVVVGLGAALGREGSVKHAGAAIASWLSTLHGMPADERRLLVACGAGAGLAAAYNVPFGGALFAMEVLLGSMSLPHVVPAMAASLIATLVSWIFLPNRQIYSLTMGSITPSEIVWAAVLGPLIGLAAVAYIRGIAWADRQHHRGWRALAAPFVALAALGLVSLAVPEVLGNGKDVVEGALSGTFSLKLLAVLFLLRPLGSILCLAGGVPGGLFTPTLSCGAAMGAFGGGIAARIVPGIDPNRCAMIAAGAFVAAATEGPVSAIVLMIELTHRINSLVVPLMLAVAGANLAARWLEPRSIYSARIKVRPSGAVVPRPAAKAAPGRSHHS